MGRADQPVHACGNRHLAQPDGLAFRSLVHTGSRKCSVVHAGKDGHGQHTQGGRRCLYSGREHTGSARCVHREQVCTGVSSHTHGACHRMGNVVQLEIEEDLQISFLEFLHDRAAFRQVEFQTHFYPAYATRKPVGHP